MYERSIKYKLMQSKDRLNMLKERYLHGARIENLRAKVIDLFLFVCIINVKFI